ncbi:MAG: hypothetical protein RR137_10910 [Odoribacter sp.]
MKNLSLITAIVFATYTIATFIGGCIGATHQFGLSAICFILSLAFWNEYLENNREAGA